MHFAAIFGDWIGQEADAAPDLVTAYAAEFARWTKRTRPAGTPMIAGMEMEARDLGASWPRPSSSST